MVTNETCAWAAWPRHPQRPPRGCLPQDACPCRRAPEPQSRLVSWSPRLPRAREQRGAASMCLSLLRNGHHARQTEKKRRKSEMAASSLCDVTAAAGQRSHVGTEQ